jgi:Flp pilus assembly protein TadG
MQSVRINREGERGSTLIEFTITAAVFFMMLVGIVAGAHLFFTHNALTEATRRGARYALFQCSQNDGPCLQRANLTGAQQVDRIKNVVLYNSTTPGSSSMVSNLTAANIIVEHSTFDAGTGQGTNYGVGQGTVTIRITNYNYRFVIPGIDLTLQMPEYRTTLTGENSGYVPQNR